jgi:protein-tyrosine phosphatase
VDVPSQFSYHHINVPDFGVPSERQIETFLDIMHEHDSKGEPVVIHCVAGCGRTGQFIVAWCAKAGYISKSDDPVEWIIARRRCCLETADQRRFAEHLVRKYAIR